MGRYDALNMGWIEVERLRGVLTGRARLRPDAAISPDRLFCHVYGRGKNQSPRWSADLLREGRGLLLDLVDRAEARDAAAAWTPA
jgi:hypothetical protein